MRKKTFYLMSRLFVCLFTVLTSTTAFAAAGWLGAGAIYINEKVEDGVFNGWYYADQHSSTSWCNGGAFNGADLGNLASLTIGGQVQLWDESGADWGSNNTAKMYYSIDGGATQLIILNYYKFQDNNNFFQSGGDPMVTTDINISGLTLGEHTLSIYFDDTDSRQTTATYTANFTKVTDISGATVTGVDASYEWTGNVINPVPVVELNNETLISGTDYDVTYSDGCTKAGKYTVTITGKGDYAGKIEKTFTITDVYYVVNDNNGWVCDQNYKLIRNLEADVEEYIITNVALLKDDLIKVTSPSKGEWGWWYPDGTDTNYQIEETGLYTIYFRPDGQGGNDWHYGYFYVAYQGGTTSVNVTLAPTGYGTYYNGVCDVTLPENTVAYIITAVNSINPTYQLIADGSDDSNNTVPAGTAVMLYNSAKPASVTLTLTPSSTTGNYNENLLKGSDVEKTTTGGATYYKLTYGNDDTTFGWYWGADGGAAFTSPGHKAWLALPTGARTFLGLPGDDNTGIATIKDNQQNADNVWYDLNGHRINAPMTKGIYVKDGRKLVIK